MIKYSRLLVKGDNRLDLPDTSGRTVLHLAAMIQVLDKKKIRKIYQICLYIELYFHYESQLISISLVDCASTSTSASTCPV